MKNVPSSSKVKSKELKVVSKPKFCRSLKPKTSVQCCELSPWEKIRLDNIRECQEMMLKLGLIKTKTEKVKIKRPKKVCITEPVRKSKRLNCDPK